MDIAGMVKGMPEIPLSIELPNLKRIEELGVAGHAQALPGYCQGLL